MRKTLSFTQVVTVKATDSFNASFLAANKLDENKWEYDTDYVDVDDVEEVEDA